MIAKAELLRIQKVTKFTLKTMYLDFSSYYFLAFAERAFVPAVTEGLLPQEISWRLHIE